MPITQTNDPILSRFCKEVTGIYGDKLERMILFGSRARGDNSSDSDYDIAVFLKNPDRLWTELGRLGDI